MPPIRIKWSTLLNLTELEFLPEPPKVLKLSDEMITTLSWLTAATGHDRKLLRCTEQGALLVGNAWDNMASVETDELYPQSGSADTFTATLGNKGVLLAVGMFMIKATFTRVSGGDTEVIYVPAKTLLFYPHTTYSVQCNVVPDPNGSAGYVGITAFN